LNFCHLLPGPEAQQLASWIGWKLHGLRGGLAPIPDWTSLDWRAALLAFVAAVLVFHFRWNVMKVLGAAAIGGPALAQIG
jgi:chromate transport protein ChrA